MQSNTNEPQIVAEFKLVMVGDGSVGKTTFVKRHVTGEFDKVYKPTKGVEVTSIVYYTNHGPIRFNIWDTAGQEKLGKLRECYYIGANCAIIMFDLTTRVSYNNVPKWYKDLTKICENIPIVLVGNKADVKERKLKARQINFHRRRNLQYYDVSAKSNYQFAKPFEWLLRALTGDQNLFLTAQISLINEDVQMSADQIKELEQQRVDAENQPLPDNDNEDGDFL